MKILLLLLVFIGISTQAQNIWKCHSIDSAGSGADGVKLADINGDGRLDIATGWEESGLTKVYLQPKSEVIHKNWPSVIIGKTPNVEDAVFADVNNDGKLDVICCTENNSQKIFIHWNPGADYLNPAKWEQDILPVSGGLMSWMYSEPMQVDNKNGVDLIAAGKGKNAALGWFEATGENGNLFDWKWHEISKVGWIMSILKEDMDADGDLDLVITDRNGDFRACRWLENPNDPELQKRPWKNHVIGAAGSEVMFMSIYDMNGDKSKEILVAERTTNTVRIFSEADEKWDEKVIKLPAITGLAKSVEAGDINNDGVVDIVVSTNTLEKKKNGLVWLNGLKLNNPQEKDWLSISGIHKAKYDKVELIDIDQDGDLDILICEENYGENSEGLGVVWYENPFVK